MSRNPPAVRTLVVLLLSLLTLSTAAGCGESSGPVTGPGPYGNRPPIVDAPIGVVSQVGDTVLVPLVVSDPDGDEVTLETRVILTADEIAGGYQVDARIEDPGPRLWFAPRATDMPLREFIVIGFDGGGLADTAIINVVVNP